MKTSFYFPSVFFLIFNKCYAASSRSKPFIRSSFYLDLFAKAEFEFIQRLNESMLEDDEPLRNLAQNYLREFEENLQNLKNVTSTSNSTLDVLAITGNLLSIFQLVHRWVHYVLPLKQSLEQTRPDIVRPVNKYEGFSQRDLKASMRDILHIFHTYNVNVSLGVDGLILGTDVGTKLSAEHCFQIAEYARSRAYHALSIQFYEEALRKSGDSSFQRVKIQLQLSKTIKEHDKLLRNESLHPFQKQYLFHRRIAPLIKQYGENHKHLRIYQRLLLANIPTDSILSSNGIVTTLDNPYEQDLCLYRNLQSDEEKKSLFCWYELKIHPYVTINPLKMELLSMKPELLQIYDVITPSKVEFIKQGFANKSYHNDTYYDPQNTYFTETVDNFDELRIFPLEFALMSAFKPWGLTELVRNYVHSYTPGSKMYRHYDLTKNHFGLEGSVAVSILYYLEEPVLGGETTFLHPRITVRPVVGSGIYWISSLNEGHLDFEMLHGSCPVILGRKLVLSKFLQLDYQYPRGKGRPYMYEKYRHFPRSKILKQKVYSKLGRYYENKNYAGSNAEHFLVA